MRPLRHRDARGARAAWSVALALALQACATQDPIQLAPTTPLKPWPIPPTPMPAAQAPPRALAEPVAPQPEVDRLYDLPALIDLAQRINPQTRDAWERARQAALAVGLVESTYLPQISAEALAGYQRTPLPIPSSLIPEGHFTATTREILPTIAVKWLLFDFGRRDGAQKAARENSFVANVAFTGAHQKLIYAVTRDYYALGAARGKRHAAQTALKTSTLDGEAVDAKREHGLATVVDVAKAQRQVAQAQFNLARAQGAEQKAYAALLASVGVAPTAKLRISDESEQPLPAPPAATLDEYVTQALENRPDILAGIGKVRAAQAALEKERAEHRPTIAMLAQGYQNIGAISTNGGPYYSVNKPGGAVFFQFSWPLFDGGRRDRQVAIAQSEVEVASGHLERARTEATKEVVDAYSALTTALAAHAAATELTKAARVAHAAGLDAYRQGVGTYTALLDDENVLVQAQTELEDARASVLTAAAALAFVTGAIGSSGQLR